MKEKDINKLIDDKLSPIIETIAKTNLQLQTLREDFNKFKEDGASTGVYLDGCPDYAVDYIKKDDKNERGE